MNPDDSRRRVRELFDRVLDLPREGREAWLAGECRDDTVVRDEVARLLEQHDRSEAEGFLGREDAGTEAGADAGPRAHHLRCPHCRGPIEVVEARPTAQLTCPSCGSSFRVNMAATGSFRPDRDRFGRFELLHVVGEGSYGTVFKARDPKLRRIVALKVPRDANVLTAEDRARFFREARNAAQLNHPAIVPVFEVDEHEGIPYILSEFVDGVSLADRLSDPLRLPGFREAAALVADVAEAIHYAHETGVIHRDIKPENILIDASGRPRVTDFGLAKREAGETSIAVDGRPLGSPAYMSPEQAEGRAHDADARSDVYCLGIMFYQLLTGTLPFQGTWSMLLHHHLHTEPRPLRTLNDRIPRDLETLCLKALEKAPSGRYQTARTLADDLRHWLNGEPIDARPVGRIEKAWRWTRRHPGAAGMVAASAVASVALVAVGFFVIYNGRLQSSRAQLLAANRTADLYLYFLRINQADAAWRDNQPLRSSELLDACPAEHRAWEWHYLDQKRHASLLDLKGDDVAFSPDGRRIATAGDVAKIWDAAAGRELVALKDHDGYVSRVTFSPDGRRIATVGDAMRVMVWDTATGSELLALKCHDRFIGSVAFSPDGRRIATAGDSVEVWDAGSGQQLHSLRGQADPPVMAVSYSPDGRRVVACLGNLVKVWDAGSGQELLTFSGHKSGSPVMAVAFSPDGRHIASAGDSVRVWDAGTGRELLSLPSSANTALEYSPDGRRVVVAGGTTIGVWDAATGQQLSVIREPDSSFTHIKVAYSPDGRRIASASLENHTVKVWDASTGQEALTLRGQTGRVFTVAYSPDGRRIATVGDTVKVWDTSTGRELLTLSGHSSGTPVDSVAFSPDGRRIATAGDAVRVWDAGSGRELFTLSSRARANGGLAVAYSPDGRRIATAGDAVRVWDAGSGRELFTLHGQIGAVMAVAYSPDGRHIATAGDMVRVWYAETGRELLTLSSQAGPIRTQAVTYSPDGRRIATAGDAVKVWDAGSGRELLSLKGHTSFVLRVSFSPDGRRIATAGESTVKIWDVATGQELLTLQGYGIVAFSPNGRQIATHDHDVVKIWDGTPLAETEVVQRRTLADQRWAVWQRGEALDCVRQGQWFAALWHLDRMIASSSPEARLFIDRAVTRAQLSQWQEAEDDINRAIMLPDAPAEAWSRWLLVCWNHGDIEGSRRTVARLLDRLNERAEPSAANLLSWYCVRLPDVVADLSRPLELARLSVSDSPHDPGRLTTLGAALYRAGRYNESIRQLNESLHLQTQFVEISWDKWANWLFLAMAEARLGHGQEAHRWLDEAERSLAVSEGAPSYWEFYLESRFLLREANSLVRSLDAELPENVFAK